MRSADLRAADLSQARLDQVDLADADLGSARMGDAILTPVSVAGARFNATTQFPPGFDPEQHGMERDATADDASRRLA